MSKISLEAVITDKGLLKPKEHLKIKNIFRARGWVGKSVILEVSKYYRNRTNRQNRYIWGVMVPIIQRWILETQGEKVTKDQAYMYLRMGVLEEKPVITEIAGTEVITFESKRFSRMNTKEFSEAIEEVIAIMAERGCAIPLPNEENLITDFL